MSNSDNGKSYVALHSHFTSLDIGMIMQSWRARNTENSALDNVFPKPTGLSEITIVHVRVMVLEQIGLNPSLHPEARVWRRRRHPIPNGSELWQWIAEQPDMKRSGITEADVFGFLTEARGIIQVFGHEYDIRDGYLCLK